MPSRARSRASSANARRRRPRRVRRVVVRARRARRARVLAPGTARLARAPRRATTRSRAARRRRRRCARTSTPSAGSSRGWGAGRTTRGRATRRRAGRRARRGRGSSAATTRSSTTRIVITVATDGADTRCGTDRGVTWTRGRRRGSIATEFRVAKTTTRRRSQREHPITFYDDLATLILERRDDGGMDDAPRDRRRLFSKDSAIRFRIR